MKNVLIKISYMNNICLLKCKDNKLPDLKEIEDLFSFAFYGMSIDNIVKIFNKKHNRLNCVNYGCELILLEEGLQDIKADAFYGVGLNVK